MRAVVKIGFDKELEGEVYAHCHSQVSHVVVSECHNNVDGVINVLHTVDNFFVPPSAKHGTVCATGGILIDTFSPLRKEFLKTSE